MVFPRPEWEQFRARIAALPMSAQWWKRIFLGNAMDVEMDATGRVLISPEMARDWRDDEIAVVVAHKLSHHKHHDLAQMLALDALLL